LFDKWNNRELQDIHTKPESQVNMYYNAQIKDLAIEFNTDFLKGGVTTNTVNTENSEEYGERVINSTGKLSNTLWAAKLQLSYPVWKGNLMFGCEYTTISRGDQYINNELQNFSSSVNVNEQSLALFSQYQATTKVGSFSFGLRYEDAAYDYLVNNKISDEMSHRYGQWFPNASYSVRLGGVGLQLNYNSRVERPTYRQLSNNMTYGNRFTIESGNPYLTPTIKQSASLMGVWKFIQAQVSYTQKNDAIVMWIDRYVQDPKVSLITYRNIDKLPALLANIAIAPTFGIWKPQLSAGVNKQWLDLTSYGVDMKLNAPMYFVSLNNIIELANNFTINIDGAYRSKGNSDLTYL
ncbi:MAG: outer membrane beta-barrel protein, partial [Tannerellaceae bacterium]